MKIYWTSFSLAYESSLLCGTILPINDSMFTYLFRKTRKKKNKRRRMFLLIRKEKKWSILFSALYFWHVLTYPQATNIYFQGSSLRGSIRIVNIYWQTTFSSRTPKYNDYWLNDNVYRLSESTFTPINQNY